MNPEQSLNMAALRGFAESLDWQGGVTKNYQCNCLFLRAASLGIPAETALAVAREFVTAHGGKLVHRDLLHQCRSAHNKVANGDTGPCDLSRFTPDANGNLVPPGNLANAFDRQKLAQRAAAFPSVVTRERLRALSTSWPSCPFSFLRGLYPRQVVLVYDSMESARPMRFTKPLPAALSGPHGIWFLSNPVDGRPHAKEGDGKLSLRCAAAVTDFRHLVLECDKEGEGVADDWLRFLVLLPMAVRAIYTSGGKSVHALVAVNTKSKPEWDAMVGPWKRGFAEHGADPNAMSAVRLTRLPYCFREDTGRWQELLYYRPEADSTPIAELEVAK
jgi:hypothetical protein